MAKRSIFITGATGFVGSHLLSQLDGEIYDIHIATRAKPKSPPMDVTTHVVGDIDGDTSWDDLLAGIHTVIHLAARAHQIKDKASDPEKEFYRVNRDGTLRLAQAAIEAGVQHFIFISSIGAMATLSAQPLDETLDCHPDTPYSRSKLDAERGLSELCAGSPMNWTILRPTLVYGPGNPGNMERLIKLVDSGMPIPLGGINQNHRSLTYVGNLSNAIEHCIEHSQAWNQLFIISDNEQVSTAELIKAIAHLLSKKHRLINIPVRALELLGSLTGKRDAIDRLTGSLAVKNHKVKTYLDWTPPFNFTEGLKRTIQWYSKTQHPDKT